MRDTVRTFLIENVQPRPGRRGWHGGPTPLGAVRGVSAAQAAWAPAPGRKSTWQLALHIAYWNYAVRRSLAGGTRAQFPRTPSNWPRVPATRDARHWALDVALLKTEHEQLVAAIAAVSVRRYSTVPADGKRWTVGELIVGIAQHDAYHAGQIQLLKRLWTATHARKLKSRRRSNA